MNIIDIINKKRLNEELSKEEIEYAFFGYLKNKVEDYQMSSLLMAICINGMNFKETLHLTDIFIKSGKTYDIYKQFKYSVDKHSTGGIGDKVSLIVVPLVASCNIVVPKMSGRSLGITGGTIDKLESIKGFKTTINDEEFLKQLKDIKCAIISQNKKLCPLDKKIYALRDVTATTNSIPLIASSIMSKKIALGTKNIVIDLKVGSGALIKDLKTAKKLKYLLTRIADHYKRNINVVISDMDTPLGNNIGNKLEVIEALEVLEGKQNDLSKKCIQVAANMVSLVKKISVKQARIEVEKNLENKKALEKFKDLVKYQKGNLDNLEINAKSYYVKSNDVGIIKEIDAYKIGKIVKELGAGRNSKDDKIDYNVGIKLLKKVGDNIDINENLCIVYYNRKRIASAIILDAFKIK